MKGVVAFLAGMLFGLAVMWILTGQKEPGAITTTIMAPDSSLVAMADSLEREIVVQAAVIAAQADRITMLRKKGKQVVDSIKRLSPGEQGSFFAHRTGVDSLTMIINPDSLYLVPVAGIRRANILITEGDQAAAIALRLDSMIDAQAAMIETYQADRLTTTDIINDLTAKGRHLASERDQALGDLKRERIYNKILTYISTASVATIILVLLL